MAKRGRGELAARYLEALHAHLQKSGPGNGDRAQGLGRAAPASGLPAVDLAQIYSQAVVALAASPVFARTRELIARIGYFLTQALLPLEEAQRATRVSVSLSALPEAICIEIKDDCRSFSVEEPPRSKTFERPGLIGVKENIEMVGIPWRFTRRTVGARRSAPLLLSIPTQS